MTIKLRRLSFLSVLAGVVTHFCLAGDVPVLGARDLPNSTIVKTEYYAGKALFGYMDGGAELYLEYKFQNLGRQEIRFLNETIVAEIYQMAGAYEAYGIFSIQRFKCMPVDSASPYTCQSKYQLQAVVGDCYLSIINESGTPAARKASFEIYKAIRAKVTPREISFPAFFRIQGLRTHVNRLMVIYGTLGIQNGFTEWEPFFEGISRFTLTLIPIEEGSEHLTVAHVRFLTPRDASEFCRLSGFASPLLNVVSTIQRVDAIRSLKRINEMEVLFTESSISFRNRDVCLPFLSQ